MSKKNGAEETRIKLSRAQVEMLRQMERDVEMATARLEYVLQALVAGADVLPPYTFRAFDEEAMELVVTPAESA